MTRILVVNGPNLDLLGRREPEIYGSQTLPEIEDSLARFGEGLGVDVAVFQSNHEGEIIDMVHREPADGIVINPGALGHTSRALADAIEARGLPTVEVHISNIAEREPWRADSVIAAACVRTIYGRGVAGYRAALRHLLSRSFSPAEEVRYGPHPDNVGDLRRGHRGVLVFLHGGVWRHQYERDTIESLAVDAHGRGFTTLNLEYRRIGKGGGWPGTAHDVLMALDYLPQIGLGTGPLTVVGHSAGGYLGLWATPRSRSPVDLVVGLAPVVDLELGVEDAGELEHESRLFLEAGAPARLDGLPVPVVAVHPEGDPVVSPGHSTGLAARREIDLALPDLGHFDLLDPSKPHWQWVVDRLPG